MIEQGISDAAIMRRAHIKAGSLAAFKACYTRKQQNTSREEIEENPIRERVTKLLERKVEYATIYADPQLRNATRGTIAAYIAHWSRGSYKK